jgi:hypothetical protein
MCLFQIEIEIESNSLLTKHIFSGLISLEHMISEYAHFKTRAINTRSAINRLYIIDVKAT